MQARVDKIEAVARQRLKRAGVADAAADMVIAKARESSQSWLDPSPAATIGKTAEQELEGRLCGAFVSVAMLHALLFAARGPG